MVYILISLCVISSGIFSAIMDKINFHFERSVFSKRSSSFWNPLESWKNKWKKDDYTKERFPGSSTIFVGFTDAWHLFKTLSKVSLMVASFLCGSWWLLLICYIIHSMVFELFFRRIFEKRK